MTAHNFLAAGRQQAEQTASIAQQDAQEIVEQAVRKAPATLAAGSSEPVQPSNAAVLDVSAAAAVEGDHASACIAQENLAHNESDAAEDALQLASLQVTAHFISKVYLWGAASSGIGRRCGLCRPA